MHKGNIRLRFTRCDLSTTIRIQAIRRMKISADAIITLRLVYGEI
jgi:hypothetical protein